MNDRIVFETNAKTIHEMACKKRDENGDFSDFQKIEESRLHDMAYRWVRDMFSPRYESEWAGRWYAIDQIQLMESGGVFAVVRYEPMADRMDDLRIEFIRVSFRYCPRWEVQDCIESEKRVLTYWKDNNFTDISHHPLYRLDKHVPGPEDN